MVKGHVIGSDALLLRDNPGMALFGKGHFMHWDRPKGLSLLINEHYRPGISRPVLSFLRAWASKVGIPDDVIAIGFALDLPNPIFYIFIYQNKFSI